MSHTELQDWEANNVDLWINNDEELYCDAYGKVTMIGPKEAAKEMWRMLKGKKTRVTGLLGLGYLGILSSIVWRMRDNNHLG